MLRAIAQGLGARASGRMRRGRKLGLRRVRTLGAERRRDEACEQPAELADLVTGQPAEEALLHDLEERLLRLGHLGATLRRDRRVHDARVVRARAPGDVAALLEHV